MDEWLSVGDKDFKKLAKKRITDLVNRAEILVLASHSQKLLQDSCNRFCLLESGRGREIDNLVQYFKAKPSESDTRDNGSKSPRPSCK
jgi:ABC-type polysaccharide/polyol phosphate transport system ATPase subunit